MIHAYDRATMAHAMTLDLDPWLHRLLVDRITNLPEELRDWTEYLVVQEGDTEDDILRHIGLSPLLDPVSGARFGEPGFEPGWDWLAKEQRVYETVFTFGSTFAYVVFVHDVDGVMPDLLRLCRTYCRT